jgi:predicted acylesterase/phospholipase RssA
LRDWISRVRHDPRFKRLKAYFLNAIGRIAMTAVDDIKEALGKEDFGKARRLLSAFLGPIGREPAQLKWARQKLALATYKDKEVQTEPALEEALQVLAGEGLKSSTDPETLGLAGAIHKRLWEITRDTRQLTQSLAYYMRVRTAAEADDLEKWAYGAVNAALILDLLAAEENTSEENTSDYRSKADGLRQSVCSKSDQILAVTDPDKAWWLRASLIEAFFGLGDSKQAEALLVKSLELNPQEWQRESMARQLSSIARLHYGPDELDAAFQALSPLVTGNAARALLIGKVGLALSGGGFRAALFHVGVLARLAELDVLRHVEALSCVSGGSILGALYYLELRRELMKTPDGGMNRDVFIRIVATVQDKLIAELKKDIRTRAMLKSLLSLTSRRTILTGKMIDQALYADTDTPCRRLRGLTVQPNGEPEGFHPRRNNWRRSAKVPILVINATSLNTGHNWQFTASYMGEPPTCIEPAVDASERLRRMYYEEAPSPHDEIELHTAVGASAAVPGIFRPIKLRGLYPNRDVRLSDGGVHDNQGIFGLVEQDCNVLIVSDGCGQLTSEPKPSRFFIGVLGRTTNVLMDTVRRNSYRLLALQFRNKRIREFHFIHLKRGLPTRDITWVRGRPGGSRAVPDDAERSGLDAQTQRALAAIRTDLDSFSDNECHALMFAGYRMACRDFAQSTFFTAGPETGAAQWKFLAVGNWMDESTASTAPRSFIEELECGKNLFFRRVRLSWAGRACQRLRGLLRPSAEPEV